MKIEKKFINQNRSGENFNAIGIVVHSTACPGATANNEYSYFNNNYIESSAHAFIDWNGIIQTIPFHEVAWHAGYTANHKFIGIELCEPTGYNKEQFNKVYLNAVEYFAYILKNILGINTVTKDNLMSHADVSRKWKETDHLDPESYFSKYGKSVNQFRIDVQNKINGGGNINTELNVNEGIVVADVLNVRSGPGTGYEVIGQLNQGATVKINKKVNNFYDIYFGNNGGYISCDYVKTNYNKPTEQPKSQKQYRNVVVYAKDTADEHIANILSWYLEDCRCVDHTKYVEGMGRSVYSIGGLTGIKADVVLRGKSRKETLDLVLKRIGIC